MVSGILGATDSGVPRARRRPRVKYEPSKAIVTASPPMPTNRAGVRRSGVGRFDDARISGAPHRAHVCARGRLACSHASHTRGGYGPIGSLSLMVLHGLPMPKGHLLAEVNVVHRVVVEAVLATPVRLGRPRVACPAARWTRCSGARPSSASVTNVARSAWGPRPAIPAAASRSTTMEWTARSDSGAGRRCARPSPLGRRPGPRAEWPAGRAGSVEPRGDVAPDVRRELDGPQHGALAAGWSGRGARRSRARSPTRSRRELAPAQPGPDQEPRIARSRQRPQSVAMAPQRRAGRPPGPPAPLRGSGHRPPARRGP